MATAANEMPKRRRLLLMYLVTAMFLFAFLNSIAVAVVNQRSEALELCSEKIASENWYGASDPCMTAAKQGHAVAQYHLGYLFDFGYGFEHSYTEAAHWWTMAADQGYAKAKDALSVYYELGVGVQHNITKAFRLVEEAAMTGLPTAQTRLGRFYLDDEAVEKNETKAYLWLFIGKENGNQKAKQLLEETRWNIPATKTRILEQAGDRCVASDYRRCSTQLEQ